MARDHGPELPYEHAHRTHANVGRETPRGGRASGTSRPESRGPAAVRDALVQQLALPSTEMRLRVWAHDRSYDLRRSEVRTLAAVGAFRVVDTRDFGATSARDRWHGDFDDLHRQGLVALSPHVLDGERTMLVTLTRDGHALLQANVRAPSDVPQQQYHAGLVKPRELAHDAQLYRAYADAAARLYQSGGRVRRVVLDYELKSEYQRFLQANNHAHRRSSGRPDRTPEEVRAWAVAHELPIVKDRVQFPDVRVEYDHPDGRRAHEDLEVVTPHYSARQRAAKSAAGFHVHHSQAGRLGGRLRGDRSRPGGSPFDPHTAARILR